jgi:hypothetical protein
LKIPSQSHLIKIQSYIKDKVRSFVTYLEQIIKKDKSPYQLVHTRDFYRVDQSASSNIQSRIIDNLLYPEIADIEYELKDKYPIYSKYNYDKSDLFEGSQPWIGLHQQVLQTPYQNFLNLFEFLEKKYAISTIVDVGAAYGRAAFVKSSVFEDATFIGYEIVKKRAEYANKLLKEYNIYNSTIIDENVFESELIDADLYILYDFSNESDIHHLLEILAIKAQNGLEFLIGVAGQSTPKILELYFTDFSPIGVPIKPGEFSVYSTSGALTSASP